MNGRQEGSNQPDPAYSYEQCGGDETDRLVREAGNILLAKLREANARDIALILLTVGLVIIGFFQAVGTIQSANAAKDAAEAAARQVELSERPWLRINNVTTSGEGPYIPAVSFQRIGPWPQFPGVSYQVTLQLDASIENVGHSVAHAYVYPSIFLPQWNSNDLENDILAERDKVSRWRMTVPPGTHQTRIILFPGDKPYEWHGGVGIPISPSNITAIPQIWP